MNGLYLKEKIWISSIKNSKTPSWTIILKIILLLFLWKISKWKYAKISIHILNRKSIIPQDYQSIWNCWILTLNKWNNTKEQDNIIEFFALLLKKKPQLPLLIFKLQCGKNVFHYYFYNTHWILISSAILEIYGNVHSLEIL